MAEEGSTVVWITGATMGIGAALARNVPWPNARVVNISRRTHPTLETFIADLTDPRSWTAMAQVALRAPLYARRAALPVADMVATWTRDG